MRHLKTFITNNAKKNAEILNAKAASPRKLYIFAKSLFETKDI